MKVLLFILAAIIFLIVLQLILYAIIVHYFGDYINEINKLYKDRTNEKERNRTI